MATTRRPFVGGNWKMNTDLASAVELADDIVAACSHLADRCDIALYPPFPYLQVVGRTLGHHGFLLGAQNVYHQSNGAYTGEVSTDMLLDLNVKVVLVGHSERPARLRFRSCCRGLSSLSGFSWTYLMRCRTD